MDTKRTPQRTVLDSGLRRYDVSGSVEVLPCCAGSKIFGKREGSALGGP